MSPSRRPAEKRELLRRTAQLFDPPPAADPYYVQAPTPMQAEQAPGWYWRPAGAAGPEYLGSNVYMAETTLQLKLRDRQAAA